MDALEHVVDYGVIGLLVALSLWALAVAVERWLYDRRVTVLERFVGIVDEVRGLGFRQVSLEVLRS